MTFPPNNLPSDSRYWVREVEKKLVNLENSFRSAEINNVTRDSQLGVTASSALNAASTAQTSLDAVVSLSDSGSGYSINADNISAGSITSSDFYTANAQTTSGIHISTAENAIKFLDGSNNQVGKVWSGSQSGGYGVRLETDGSAYIMMDGDSIVMNGDFNTGFQTNSTNNAIFGPTTINSTLGVSGTFSTKYVSPYDGTLYIQGALSSSGDLETNASLRRTVLAGGGTTLCAINNSGNFQRDSSSARYKTDIADLGVTYDEVLSLQPRQYRLKEEVESNPESARTYAGFIAEEIHDAGLDVFVSYSQDEQGNIRPEGVQYHHLTSALLLALKEQDKTIKSLEARIEALEAK